MSPSFTDELARALVHQSQEIARRIDGVRAGHVHAVHRARVASRRLREVLAVLVGARTLGARDLRRRVRRLTEALGGLREADVMLQEIRSAAKRHGWPRDVVRRVRRPLLAERAACRLRVAEALRRMDNDVELADECQGLADQMQAAPADRRLRAALARRVSSRAASAVHAIVDCGTGEDPARLHQVRIAVKKLRYALELAPVTPENRTFRDELHAAQQQLGHWHDLHLLTEAVLDQQEVLPGPAGPLTAVAKDLDRERRALRRSAVSGLPPLAVRIMQVRQSEGDRTWRRSRRIARMAPMVRSHVRRA